MARRLSQFGMLIVLLLLCAGLSIATWTNHSPQGIDAAKQVASQITGDFEATANVLVVAGAGEADQLFSQSLNEELVAGGFENVQIAQGEPRDVRRTLKELEAAQQPLDVIAASPVAVNWPLVNNVPTDFPTLRQPVVLTPGPYSWPTFLQADNLLNIANRVSVIAILSIGMTMVILTGGIDLSVGSLIALASVATCLLIERWGAESASCEAMLGASFCGIAVTGAVGFMNGFVTTRFRVPSFIVTLATMLIASGAAFLITGGESAYHIPRSFSKLGVGSAIGRIPNAALLTVVLYLISHIVLSKTVIGRYLYAAGGNPEAAHLSGVRVNRVLIFAYTVSGLLAGLGGVVMASQLKGGSPKFGEGYELSVIAAVVVGGTSLSGGEGSVIGTLVGTLIIAVIQNGMNLMNVNAYTQNIVLGCVILIAVLLDNLKRRGRTR